MISEWNFRPERKSFHLNVDPIWMILPISHHISWAKRKQKQIPTKTKNDGIRLKIKLFSLLRLSKLTSCFQSTHHVKKVRLMETLSLCTPWTVSKRWAENKNITMAAFWPCLCAHARLKRKQERIDPFFKKKKIFCSVFIWCFIFIYWHYQHPLKWLQSTLRCLASAVPFFYFDESK